MAAAHTKTVSLKIDDPLYSLLEMHAGENGEGLNELIQRLLCESMDGWCDYCDAMRRLADDDDRPIHVCVGK